MRCLFINLDAAEARRANLTADFAKCAPPGWTLERIDAVRGSDVSAVPGRSTPGAKGCFLSHRRALEASVQSDGDVLILEDDAAFSARGFEALANILRAEAAWDFLMTDLAVLKPAEIVAFARQRERFDAHGALMVGNLAEAFFVGASGYVVRHGAKAKLLELLDPSVIDLPYDVALRELVHTGRLAGRFCVPFLTTLSTDAAASQIHLGETTTIAALNAFRRLLFIDRDLAGAASELDALQGRVSLPAQLYGKLFAAVVAGD